MRAILLAAGRGSRLRPFTDHRPKCMVEVLGRPLLDSALAALERAEVPQATIVVGYLADQIRETYGTRFGGVKLSYVENPVFESTNTLYGLWMARGQMNDDILLLETDRLYEPEVISELVRSPYQDVALVDELKPHMDGTVVFTEGDRVRSMVLRKDQRDGFDVARAMKTVSVYKLSAAFLEHSFIPAMGLFVRSERTDEPYEALLAELIAQGDLALHAHLMGHRPWADIDDPKDLRIAEATFAVATSGSFDAIGSGSPQGR